MSNKTKALVFLIVGALAFVVLILGRSWNIDAGAVLRGASTWTVVAYDDKGLEVPTKLRLDSAEAQAVLLWLDKKRDGWELAFIPVVPGLSVLTGKGALNVTPRTVALYAGFKQFSREISREDCEEFCKIILDCRSMNRERGCDGE